MKPIALLPVSLLGVSLLGLAGCATGRGVIENPLESQVAVTAPDGRVLANARLSSAVGGVRVYVQSAGLPAGTYAVHIHQVGTCEGAGFTAAGPHWNPTNREHGASNPAGTHLGDLPNLVVAANGEGSIGFVVRNATMSGPENAVIDADGAAVVVHAAPDDYRTDPSGNSGDRIGCGVLPAPTAVAAPPAPSSSAH